MLTREQETAIDQLSREHGGWAATGTPDWYGCVPVSCAGGIHYEVSEDGATLNRATGEVRVINPKTCELTRRKFGSASVRNLV